MSDASTLGDSLPCPSCGAAIDARSTTRATVACPECGAEVDLGTPTGPESDPIDVADVVEEYRARGFETAATVVGDQLACGQCGITIDSSAVQADDVRRARDPATGDMTVAVAAVTCPNCGAGGHVILDYGPDGTAGHAAMLDTLEWGHQPR